MSAQSILKYALALFLLTPATSFAEECTHFWDAHLEVGGKKKMSGDTYAAYTLYGFKHEENLRLEFNGEFPAARFMSYQSYREQKKKTVDYMFDHEIEPLAGQENPFRGKVPLNHPNKKYKVVMTTDPTDRGHQNILEIDATQDVHSLYYRIYVPSDGHMPAMADMPRIFAYDTKTGKPRSCPEFVDTRYNPGFIKEILKVIRPKKFLSFKQTPIDNGLNAAVPEYRFNLNRLRKGNINVVRFMAPTTENTQDANTVIRRDTEARYWSFCMNNFYDNETLACVPDYKAKVDASGYVTIVVGNDYAVKRLAESRGHMFMWDIRKDKQKTMGLTYRNMLPAKDFGMYDGEYNVTGVSCHRSFYLSGQCGT